MLNYIRVFLTFARNSLIRDMTFRASFLIDMITSESGPSGNSLTVPRTECLAAATRALKAAAPIAT